MVGLFIMLSVVLWYVIDWFKKVLDPLPDTPRQLLILAAALTGGVLLALQFKLDVFAVAAQVMGLEEVRTTVVGQVFAGLVLASGAGGAHELIKALQGYSGGTNIFLPADKPAPTSETPVHDAQSVEPVNEMPKHNA